MYPTFALLCPTLLKSCDVSSLNLNQKHIKEGTVSAYSSGLVQSWLDLLSYSIQIYLLRLLTISLSKAGK